MTKAHNTNRTWYADESVLIPFWNRIRFLCTLALTLAGDTLQHQGEARVHSPRRVPWARSSLFNSHDCSVRCAVEAVGSSSFVNRFQFGVFAVAGTDTACGRCDEFQTAKIPWHTVRARRFLGGRVLVGGVSAAQAMDAARSQHEAMVKAMPRDSTLSAAWQPLGPAQVVSAMYGSITWAGDRGGNRLCGYHREHGLPGNDGWRRVEVDQCGGASSEREFCAVTDTLPVFSPNAESAMVPSLSIGAVSVQPGVILAGTGDPNDASDSFYGSGILRSADGGLTWTLIRNSNDGVGGNHSFAGLGFAGFAWSSPMTVVAALSQAAEGALVNAVDNINSVMGLYYSTDAGVTWQMGVIEDGSQVVQTSSRWWKPWRKCCYFGRVESDPAAFLCGDSLPWLLRVG